MSKLILHLCADLGSDSYFYQQDSNYEVLMVGEDISVENFSTDREVYGVIANPVCTELSTVRGFHLENDMEKGMFLVEHCMRIITEVKPKFWVIENPANGRLKDVLGKPRLVYQPWQYGSPWTKKTGLWGEFSIPEPLYTKWEDVPKIHELYIRPGRPKPSLAFCHKSAMEHIPEFEPFRESVKNDADFRSLCSQGFAREFYNNNK